MSMNEEGEIVLDFDNIILPEGEYFVHITSVKLSKKKNATADDFPYLEFHYSVDMRVDGTEMSPELVGTDVMDIATLNPTGRWKLKSVLEAFTLEPWEDKGMTINPEALIGLNAIAMLQHDSYNGVQRAKPSRVYNPEFIPPDKPDDVPSGDVWENFNAGK
jgi:hypothetical protein